MLAALLQYAPCRTTHNRYMVEKHLSANTIVIVTKKMAIVIYFDIVLACQDTINGHR